MTSNTEVFGQYKSCVSFANYSYLCGENAKDAFLATLFNIEDEDMKKESIINYSVLWSRIEEYGMRIGRLSAKPILILWFVLLNKDTPKKDKMLILSTLSYLILPIDILDAKRLPIIGWCDEIFSISVSYQKVCKNITPEIEAKVNAILDKWFPVFTPYELIE